MPQTSHRIGHSTPEGKIMSGFVTDKRSSYPYSNNYAIRRGLGDYFTYGEGSPYGGNPHMTNPDTQETTSFRTRGGSADDEDQEIADARRIFRNGFTSYDPEYDHGHEFFTTKTSTVTSHPYWEAWDPSATWNEPNGTGWKGPLIVAQPNGDLPYTPGLRRLTGDDIRSFGQRAINASAPTAPAASLTTIVGEILLDGGLPYVGSKLKQDVPRSHGINPFTGISSDWLNANFGWLPLVSDVHDLVKSLKSANKQIRQLARDSGRNVRRRFSFPEISEHTENSWVNPQGCWYNMPYGQVYATVLQGGEWRLTQVISRKRNIWFRGAFTYYMDAGNDIMGKLEQYEQLGNKLLGSRLNAESLWELAPWSWLIDWQSNIGTALSTASRLSEDGLVIRYGYLMCHTVDEDIWTTSNLGFKSGGLTHSNTIFRRDTKERVRATPYGFGLDLASLDAKQWSILAALGMTKGSGALKLTS
jgi:hypothetical protein